MTSLASRLFWAASASQLRRNFLSGIGMTVFSTLISMGSYPLYLHYLGYQRYGLWIVLTSVLNFANLGTLGILSALSKLVAQEYGNRNIAAVDRYVTAGIVALSLTGGTALLAAILLRSHVVSAFRLAPEDSRVVDALLPYVGLLSLYGFVVECFSSTLAGLGRIDLCNYLLVVAQATSLAITGVLLSAGFGVEGMLAGLFFSYAIRHLGTMTLVQRIVPLRYRLSGLNVASFRSLFNFGGWVVAEMLVLVPLNPLNRLMVARYNGVASVTTFDIAYTAAFRARNLVESGLRALLPEISRLASGSGELALERICALNRRSWRLVLFFGLPLYGLLLLFSRPLLQLWLKSNYHDAVLAEFRIILMGTLISMACVPSYYLLMGTGAVLHTFASGLVHAAVNIIVLAVFIGINSTVTPEAVAFATAAGMTATSVYCIAANPCHRNIQWLRPPRSAQNP